ncbi:MAG: HypC/HybG/HupF family hydrogenase formation chaperone [Ardenticatenaceae bacterium]|nr:HypC/HybG/HupF family hydrogenase formation chaperone [Ardenticatenaceae bacterium]
MCLGVPGKVTEIYEVGGLKMGKVDFGGVVREACLAYVPEIEVGEYTVIHVGFAISQISEEEAMESLEVLKEITSLEEELGIGMQPAPEKPPKAG